MPPMPDVRICSDVTCYHCGHVSGQLVWRPIASAQGETFYPQSGHTKPIPPAGRNLRCARCGGPTYLDELRLIRGTLQELAPAVKGRGRGPRRIA